jgi:hypothetical protein
MVQFDVRKVAFLLLLLAVPAAEAQLWSGPAAVEVRVEGQRGLPVAGARVQLLSTTVEPEAGPPPAVTDSRGRAVVSGLAPGSWKLEVSQEGYMTYLAEITVSEKNRPKVGLATQVNVPGALRTLRVDISRGRSEPQAARAPREQPAPAPAPAPPAPAPRRETPPPPRPEPVAPPSPPPAAPAAPVPAPEPEPALTPAPPPPAPLAADSVRMRSFEDRTCVECQPGESSLSTERVIPPGGGSGCGDVASRLQGGDVPSGLPAGCHVLRIAVPAGARYLGYRFEVQDGGAALDCLAGQDCPGNTGRWPGNPVLVRGAGGTVVLAPFEAGPADRERRAVLTVYFTTGKRRG